VYFIPPHDRFPDLPHVDKLHHGLIDSPVYSNERQCRIKEILTVVHVDDGKSGRIIPRIAGGQQYIDIAGIDMLRAETLVPLHDTCDAAFREQSMFLLLSVSRQSKSGNETEQQYSHESARIQARRYIEVYGRSERLRSVLVGGLRWMLFADFRLTL
jgi:hypothetical protein